VHPHLPSTSDNDDPSLLAQESVGCGKGGEGELVCDGITGKMLGGNNKDG
jgi:hypothetical protein